MNLKEIIDIAKSFTGSQWAAIISIVSAGIYGYNWIENRYAHKDKVDQLLEHVIRIDSKISALINTEYPQEKIEKIYKNAQLYEENLRKYSESKKSK